MGHIALAGMPHPPLKLPRAGGCQIWAGPKAGTPLQVGTPVSELCSWLWSFYLTKRADKVQRSQESGVAGRKGPVRSETKINTDHPECDVNASSSPQGRPLRLPGLLVGGLESILRVSRGPDPGPCGPRLGLWGSRGGP